MGTTQEIASFVAKTKYNDIPSKAIDTAKMTILDCLGTTLAGSRETEGRIIAEYVKENGGKPEAGVMAKGFKAPASLAALANGTMGHALDYDDCIAGGGIHPTVPILPVVMALGEKLQVSGKDVLLAHILGFEVESKIFLGFSYKSYEVGWHATSTTGTIGAAAAAAKLLGLSADEIRMALGIAASEAAGIRQNFGTMTKPNHAGCAARSGLVAALLAQKGFTSDGAILEAPLGFCNVFAGQGESDLAKMSENLGNPFSIVSPGVTIKYYPACLAISHATDVILHLAREHRISAGEVDEVVCTAPSTFPDILLHSRPKTAKEGKFSMEYCLAIALIDGEVGLKQFTDAKVLSPQVQELIPKVKYSLKKVEGWEDMRGFRHAVVIKLRDGTEFSREAEISKGDPRNPLTPEELAGKFRDCAHEILPAKDTERCLELVSNLESLENITKLMDILTLTKGV